VDWLELCEFADKHNVKELTLDLNAPWLHESFHATRKDRENSENGGNNWKAQVPLLAAGRSFGRIEVRGAKDVDHHAVVRGLMDFVANLENSLVETVEPSSESEGNPESEDESASASKKDVQAPSV